MIHVDESVYEKYPSVCFGLLCVRNFDAGRAPNFEAVKAAEIATLKQHYSNYDRKDFVLTEPVRHYVSYYKRFKKTYHVLLQLESILLKDRAIPDAEPLVQALFLTEVKHMLLIAGHDLDCVVQPLSIGVAHGGERYTGAAGEELELKADDIYLRDADGIILSIIYGQDFRTRIIPQTKNVMYLIDGVEGITEASMRAGLEDLLRYLRVFDPAVEPTVMEVLRPTR